MSLTPDSKLYKMQSSKEDIALWWENEKRKRHAEAQKRYREKKGKLKVSEMSSQDLNWKRALDRENQQYRRANMTQEERDIIRAKDRERKAKKNQEKKDNTIVFKGGKASKQQKNNNRTQKKIRDKRTEEDKETMNAYQAESMRKLRSNLTNQEQILSRMKAKNGMRLCRKFGYLGEYKQRKARCSYDAFKYCEYRAHKNGYARNYPYDRKEKMERKGERRLFRKKQESVKQLNNRLRVRKHRLKIKKLLQEPVVIEEDGKMSDYELLREQNIKEFNKLKKESGLFD